MRKLGKTYLPVLLDEHVLIGKELYEPGERVWRCHDERRAESITFITPRGSESTLLTKYVRYVAPRHHWWQFWRRKLPGVLPTVTARP